MQTGLQTAPIPLQLGLSWHFNTGFIPSPSAWLEYQRTISSVVVSCEQCGTGERVSPLKSEFKSRLQSFLNLDKPSTVQGGPVCAMELRRGINNMSNVICATNRCLINASLLPFNRLWSKRLIHHDATTSTGFNILSGAPPTPPLLKKIFLHLFPSDSACPQPLLLSTWQIKTSANVVECC